jgi:hypothetical protein
MTRKNLIDRLPAFAGWRSRFSYGKLLRYLITSAALAAVLFEGPSALAVVRSCSAGPCGISQRCECRNAASPSRGRYASAILQRTSGGDVYLTVVAPNALQARLVGVNVVAFQANGAPAPGCIVTSNAPAGITVPFLGLGSSLCDTAVSVTVQAAVDE